MSPRSFGSSRYRGRSPIRHSAQTDALGQPRWRGGIYTGRVDKPIDLPTLGRPAFKYCHKDDRACAAFERACDTGGLEPVTCCWLCYCEEVCEWRKRYRRWADAQNAWRRPGLSQPQRWRDGRWQARIDERNRRRNRRGVRNQHPRIGWKDRPPLRVEVRGTAPRQNGLRGGLVDVKKEGPTGLSDGLRGDKDDVRRTDKPLRGGQ